MATVEEVNDASEIDPIWTTSRTARQIYALGEVEKVGQFMPSGEHAQGRRMNLRT